MEVTGVYWQKLLVWLGLAVLIGVFWVGVWVTLGWIFGAVTRLVWR